MASHTAWNGCPFGVSAAYATVHEIIEPATNATAIASIIIVLVIKLEIPRFII